MRALLCWLGVAAALGAAPVPIEYTVRIPAPQTHYVEVEERVPTAGQPTVELKMAVWTQYVIREYARNLEAVTARAPDGHALTIEKSRKNRWRIETGGADPVTVSYRVYCHVMSVQDNWVDADFALLNGAPTFLTLAEGGTRPAEVRLILPKAWHKVVTGMPSAGGTGHYLAPDYETLVDSPLLAGNPIVHEFTVGGKRHYLADIGEDGGFDGKQAVEDLGRIVREDARLWGGLPYEQYVFLNMLTGEHGGGMEHSNSCALMSAGARTPGSYHHWLDLASHEFFHTWNVKRLRPAELTTGEYETEPYTKSLGISEGFTNYYGPLVLRRAGLSDDGQFLASLSHMIRELQTTPGRLVQSLSMSSFDTWIKFYRPDDNSINTAISYYTKGAVAGFLLDARVRAATGGRKSLDDVMRLALERNPVERGFTPADFRAAASAVAGTDLSAWLKRAFDSTEELDYSEALDWFGLRFVAEPAGDRAWLGAQTRVEDGHVAVTEVPRGTPAYEAGLEAGDEVVDGWPRELADHQPGERLTLQVSRRGKVQTIDVTLGQEPGQSWKLEIAGPSAHRDAWLRGW